MTIGSSSATERAPERRRKKFATRNEENAKSDMKKMNALLEEENKVLMKQKENLIKDINKISNKIFGDIHISTWEKVIKLIEYQGGKLDTIDDENVKFENVIDLLAHDISQVESGINRVKENLNEKTQNGKLKEDNKGDKESCILLLLEIKLRKLKKEFADFRMEIAF